jgi:hypothetical protein
MNKTQIRERTKKLLEKADKPKEFTKNIKIVRLIHLEVIKDEE